jgi:hypothetical protein
MKLSHLYIALLLCSTVACDNDDNSDETSPTSYQLSDAPRTPKRSIKRGVSYSFQLPEEDMRLLGNSISWFYNWGPNCNKALTLNAKTYNVSYCPMAWNDTFDASRIRQAASAFPENEYLLAYNEPNLIDQCNTTPAQAAQEWHRLKALADELNYKVVSPAMNYGTLNGYHDPVVWLDEFFTLVPLDDVDAIALHCYMGSAAALKSFIDRFDKYGKPIWLTEFCAWEQHISSVKAQMNYMSEAVNYLEACNKVERYAWFIPRANGAVESYPYMQLLTKSAPYKLSELGKVFTGISSLDTEVFTITGQTIEAESFTACNASEGILTEQPFAVSAHYAPSTDDETLMLTDFGIGKWTEYQIELHKPTTDYNICLRMNTVVKSAVEITLTRHDDSNTTTINVDCPSGGGEWLNITASLGTLAPGKYTMRIKCTSGLFSLNNLKVSYA